MGTVTDVLHAFGDAIEDHRGAFDGRVVGRQAGDGTWEGWLEFAPANGAERLVTDVESRQQTRVQLLRWASGLTPVYAEGALHRARRPAALAFEAAQGAAPDRPATDQERTDLRRRLRDLIAALDRRVPYFDRDGELEIVRDAAVLKRQAQDRLAHLE
jgi:hypothetical protein